jgi:hypothetical protein
MRTAYAVIVNGSRVNTLGVYKSESAALKAAYKAPQKNKSSTKENVNVRAYRV